MGRLTHLLDNSVHARLGIPKVAEYFLNLQQESRVGRCGLFELEAIFSALDPLKMHDMLVHSLPLVATHQADFERAVEVMLLLAKKGLHRAVGAADLVLAAVAERAELTVLHYDRDFEYIAAVTDQPVEAVVPFGSL
ncbi:MAG: PIN domain-containing protein [Candidatus Dormibacteraceae bacterium]